MAAPEAMIWCAEHPPVSWQERRVVDLLAIGRMLGAEHAIEERTLMEVGGLGVTGPREDVAGELEHVVGDAALFGVPGQFGRKLAEFSLVVLAAARAAGTVGALLGHVVPEESRDIMRPLVAG